MIQQKNLDVKEGMPSSNSIGQRGQRSANDSAAFFSKAGENAETQGYFKAGSTVLSTGANYKKSGWLDSSSSSSIQE